MVWDLEGLSSVNQERQSVGSRRLLQGKCEKALVLTSDSEIAKKKKLERERERE